MKTALDIAKLLAYCALIVLLGECAFAVHRLRPKLEVTVSNIDRATIAAGAAAGNIEKASRQWKATQEQVAKDSTAVLTQSAMSLVQVR